MLRKLPKWAFLFRFSYEEGTTVGELLTEVHKAIQGNMPRLAAMGIRSLIEHVMISKVGDQGSFNLHLNAFEKGGYISLI